PRLALPEERPRVLSERCQLARLVVRQILGRRAGEQLGGKAFRHVAVQPGQDHAGLLDQLAAGAFFVGVEMAQCRRLALPAGCRVRPALMVDRSPHWSEAEMRES